MHLEILIKTGGMEGLTAARFFADQTRELVAKEKRITNTTLHSPLLVALLIPGGQVEFKQPLQVGEKRLVLSPALEIFHQDLPKTRHTVLRAKELDVRHRQGSCWIDSEVKSYRGGDHQPPVKMIRQGRPRFHHPTESVKFMECFPSTGERGDGFPPGGDHEQEGGGQGGSGPHRGWQGVRCSGGRRGEVWGK